MPVEENRSSSGSDPELAELAALADGSLAPSRRAELERQVAASPRLQALLREQREALEAVRALDDRAPARLRRAVAARERPRAQRRLRRRIALGAAAAAAIALAVVLALPASEEEAPTLTETAALAARAPTGAAATGVNAWGIEYPDLAADYGWQMSGRRADDLGDRSAQTVFYAKGGHRIAYTIVSTGSVRVTGRPRTWLRKGKPWYAWEQNGRTVVAWERQGHMCVVSADGLNGRALVKLITS